MLRAADHYQNLSSSWAHGPIYASQTTINLIKLKLGVKDEWLHALPLDKTVKVHGIDVTLIDANQCVYSCLPVCARLARALTCTPH